MRKAVPAALAAFFVLALAFAAVAFAATTFYVGQPNGVAGTINQQWKWTSSNALRTSNNVQPVSGCLPSYAAYQLSYLHYQGGVEYIRQSAWGKCGGFSVGQIAPWQSKAGCRIVTSNGAAVSRQGFCWTTW